MLLDGTYFEGGGYSSPWCRGCHQPIQSNQPSTRIEFANDPHGVKGLTGQYHVACSKTFRSMAQVINLGPRLGN